MTDFRVVPDALRTQAKELESTSGHYLTSSRYVADNRMGAYVLGVHGRDVATVFNDQLLLAVESKLKQTQKSIQEAAEKIAYVAWVFENKDYEYYQKFGYQNERLGN
ncbi:hypothetical protein [Nocardia sp. NPDC051832]|uniref:hypothetical protein n=1 Tax=Nocardia sp. NPDC051832 TaxID=3155673 RepID=UPI00343934F3